MTSTSDTGKRTSDSLDGLSVGDALGAQFFVPGSSVPDLLAGKTPPPPWPWTDDTEMACTLAAELRDHGSVQQDRLAMAFAERCEPYRGYGPGAVVILRRIREGEPWRAVAGEAFGGQGSCGNGAAMRVAPLGAYFADDPARAAREAALSAEVTHLHPEGIAGAVAIALAAAHAADPRTTARDLLAAVLDQTAEGQVRQGIAKAAGLLGCSTAEAAYQLGNGSRVTAQDTVPFTLWVAATHLDDYAAAITACVEAGGDVDTTGAIVGGVVATRSVVPEGWLTAREPLPGW
ncbi:ADP-ribosylglycohydrolase family protein [Allokutzneria sp. A3M-2-11 16]|uniref:ADP-ribosylglycohydrolase family protein n=1 Tax=Allokutzneria sp. A3M-2-11 16 TaxID=2962043 RepID=UPI0020B88655|nr:ADP-ribosylglycohydrolase family protein [Allokutzneria sp. A3M-2-11 16]MCP3801679.1 ADP-ribosylglycohydrolase family protein [Allokutzneria sp. A3M-2-11 16]